MRRQKSKIISVSKDQEKSKEEEQIVQNKKADNNSYKDLKFNRLLKLESLGRGGFGEVAVYYDYNIQQALAVKQFKNEQHYLDEKEKNSNCDTLQDRNKYFAAMLNSSDEIKVIFYELGDCTLLEINNRFVQNNLNSENSIEKSEEKKSKQEEKNGRSRLNVKNDRKKQKVYQKWREIDLVYITFCLLNGLIYMRQNKMFHGDISPDNIMFFQNKLKYIDLGSSHLNNNQLYLKQYKKQFVNFDIMKPKKQYTDSEISQNELYALGRTITHLCLYIQQEREDIILNSNATLNSLRSKFSSFKELLIQSQSLKDYPTLSKVLLKMQYPYDEDIDQIFQDLRQEKNLVNNKQNENNSNSQQCEDLHVKESKISKKEKKILSKKETFKLCQNKQKDQEESKEKQSKALNKKRNLNELNELSDQQGYQEIKNVKNCNIHIDDEKKLIKKLKTEEQNCLQKLDTTIQESADQQVSMNTLILSDQEDQDDQQKNTGQNKFTLDINQIMIEILDLLQSILDDYVKESKIKILAQQKKDPPYDFEIYSFILEKSDLIQSACLEIRQTRLEKLLQNHPNPSKELSYLMQLDQKNWRREAAFQVIIDQLSCLSSQEQMSKETITQKVMNIVLHQQKQIILRQKTYNTECSDFIDEIIFVCIQHQLPIVQIECAFTFCLIWYFQESHQDFKYFYENYQNQLKKIDQLDLDQNQILKFQYFDSLSLLFNLNQQNNDQIQFVDKIKESILNQIASIKII